MNKKTRAKISIAVIIATLFLTLLILRVSDGNNIVKLKNYSVASGYMERGWIPKDISKNARDIFLVYNLDSNIVNMKFYIPKGEIINVLKRTESTSLENLKKETQALNIKFIPLETKLKENKDKALIRKDLNYIYVVYPTGEIYILNKIN